MGKRGEKQDLCHDRQNGGNAEKLANEEGYKSFVIPCNTGGRYSVLTAVGLLPIAAAGIDIEEMMNGAAYACEKYRDSNLPKTTATFTLL